MKLTVLGMNGPFPAEDGATSGYLVSSDESKILLDCGSGVLGRLLTFAEIMQITAIVISHTHYDHISDLYILLYMLEQYDKNGLNPEPIQLFAPKHLDEAFKSSKYFQFTPISENEKWFIKDVELSFFKTVHPTETYACSLMCENIRLVYTSDAVYNEQLLNFVNPCNTLLCDCGSDADTWTANSVHMNPAQAAFLAKNAQAKLIMTHINPLHSSEKLLKQATEIYPFVQLANEYNEYDV